MNFLAHLHASPNHPLVRVFNFSGDGYKGNRWKDYASNAELIGVGLHRHIDGFTDAHPLTRSALATLRPELGKVAGIALDLFGDYFLHKHWAQFQHLQPFTTHVSNVAFTQQCVTEISEHQALLKGKAHAMAPHLVAENWLLSYRDLIGLERAANGISRRHPVARALHGYFGDLPEGHYAAAEEWMLAFYPELIRSSQKWVEDREVIGSGL